MRGSIKFDTFRGITLHLHWTLFIPIGWIALVNARMGNDILQLSWSLLFILAVLTSIILHELAHALVAACFGINAKDIVILPIGGIASIEKFPGNPAQELAIGVAGPLINLLMFEYNGLQASMQVQQVMPVLLSNHSKYFLLMDGNRPVGTINRLMIIEAIAENKYPLRVDQLPHEPVHLLQADAPVEDVLEKLAAKEEAIFPVIDKGQFIGIVSLQHIVEYLLMHKTGTADYRRLKSLVSLLH